jgi:hypothetical protein
MSRRCISAKSVRFRGMSDLDLRVSKGKTKFFGRFYKMKYILFTFALVFSGSVFAQETMIGNVVAVKRHFTIDIDQVMNTCKKNSHGYFCTVIQYKAGDADILVNTDLDRQKLFGKVRLTVYLDGFSVYIGDAVDISSARSLFEDAYRELGLSRGIDVIVHTTR